MAKKIIKLNERQLTSLIRRIVEETEKTEKENKGKKITKDDAVDLIAKFFKKEVLPELTPSEKNKLKMKVSGSSKKSLEEDNDEDMDVDDRKGSFKDKLMIRGGGVMAATGLVGVIGRSMGWSEHETTSKIHEFIEQFGAGNYSGPITVAMITAGLAMALGGMASKYNRSQK
jgi:hypothetical protein